MGGYLEVVIYLFYQGGDYIREVERFIGMYLKRKESDRANKLF